MKVALMTIFQVPNFGSVLQTFATQCLLEYLGYDCDIINYKYPNEWHFKNGFKKPTIIDNLKRFLSNHLRIIGSTAYPTSRFIKSHLHLTRPFWNLKELEGYDWSNYHAIIAGSDQIWNPRFLKGDSAFMLSFTKRKKISISSSFACSSIPESLHEKYKKYLSDFDAISVRENNGLKVLDEDLNLEINRNEILDPTLLIDSDQWSNLLDLDPGSSKEKYIVLYILDYSFQPRPYILDATKKMAEIIGCRNIITISSNDDIITDLNVKKINPKRVEDFVSLLKNSSGIVTSSFHGTAFAVNFGKPLISVIPSGNDDRQRSLLRNLGIEHCAVTVNTPLNNINPQYDKLKMWEILNKQRQSNINWLKSVLTNLN